MLRAEQILDEEEPPALWIEPQCLDGMAPPDASYWARFNPILEAMGKVLRDEAVAELRAAGVPSRRLVTPLAPEMEAIIDRRIFEKRSLLCLIDTMAEGRPGKPRFKDAWGPIAAACILVRVNTKGLSSNAVHERAKDILNVGIPKSELNSHGLTRDHVRRVEHNFLGAIARISRRLPVHHRDDYQLTEFKLVLYRFEPLKYIHDQALLKPPLRGHSGAALAAAIHERHDLVRTFDRAAEWVLRGRDLRSAKGV